MLKQVLIVGEGGDGCSQLVDALSGAYELRLAMCADEALSILSGKNASRISAILLDLSHSAEDGLAFLETLSGTPGLRDIPVLILSNPNDHTEELKALDYGMFDYVTMPFNPAILVLRLKSTIERSEYAAFSKYRYLAEYDAISGVYNRTKFFDAVRRVLEANPDTRFILARFDLDRFKAYNDLFGMEEGDRLLREMGRFFMRNLDQETNYGRLEADHFVFCIPEERFKAGRLLAEFVLHFSSFQPNFVLSPRIGVFQIKDPCLDISLMCDRALMALRSIKSGSAQRVAYFDDSMRKRILEEQTLIGDMEEALRLEQYDVYLQPQYNHRTRKIVGAEALVRWNHPQKGMIPPNSFIPILEKNGFISKLDYYVWERVCKLLARWREQGLPSVSISVNVSGSDIRMPNLSGTLFELTQKYGIEPRDLRLEITETAYIENAEQFVTVIGALRSRGFLIEMDDFGKGYSSLNTLKNVPVDVLKLDMGFLRETESSGGRGGIILNSILHMAHWLNLPVIAEGVETLRQADYLASIGCDVVQGYLYARPLPIADFESLLARGEAGDFIGDYALLSQIDVEDLWNPDSEATTIFRSFVGAAGLFELRGGKLEALRINQKLCDLLEIDYNVFRANSANALEIFNEDQRDIVVTMLDRAGAEFEEASCQITFNGIRTGRTMLLLFRAEIIAVSVDRKVFFIGCEDFTAQQRELEEQRYHDEQSRLLMEGSGSVAFEYDPQADTLVTFQNVPKKGTERIVKKDFLVNLPSDPVLHPSNANHFKELVLRFIREPGTGTDGIYADLSGSGFRWYRISYTSLADEQGRVRRVVGRSDDIHMERERQLMMDVLDQTLQEVAETDPVTGLYSMGSINILIRNQLAKLEENERAHLTFIELWNENGALETLGSDAWSELLTSAVKAISAHMGEDDLLGRIGQRSFGLFSRSNISDKALAAKTEDLLQSIQKLPVVRGNKICVNAAIAAVTSSEPSFHHLLIRMDAALEKAKSLGAARCIFAENTPSPREGQRFAVSSIHSLESLLPDMVFHLLFNAQDIDAGIQASIVLTGRLIDVSRVFVFEQRGSSKLACQFEWCAEGISPQIERLRSEPCGSAAARDFRENFSRDGILIFRNPEEAGGKLKVIAEREDIVSLVECALLENRIVTGYIGYEERRADHPITQDQINLITTISRVLNVYVLKRRAELNRVHEGEYLDALYACVDQFALSLDSGSYKIRVCNRRIRETIGRDATGEDCYRALWNRDAPCENCPAAALDAGEQLYTAQKDCRCTLAYGLPYEGKRVLVPGLTEDASDQ